MLNQSLPNSSNDLEYLSSLLHSEIVFVDIGASTGQYVFQVNKSIDIGSIYAVEPDAMKFGKLASNCLEWENWANNCIYTLQIAVGDRESQSNTGQESVKTYRMDTLFDRIDPDLIRIGTRGNELQILKGSTKILKRGKAKFLLTATNNCSEKNFAEICTFMSAWGYSPRGFYSHKLFTNPKKLLVHDLRRIYRKVFPVAFRQRVKPIFRV